MDNDEVSLYQLDEAQLIDQIQKINWNDLEDSYKEPTNQFYEVKYPAKYVKYYKIFRGLLQKEEISQRSYLITSLILEIRSSNYYAMMLRKKYYLNLPYSSSSLIKEFHFVNCLLNENQKQYQLWTYKKELFNTFRVQIDSQTSVYERELQFLEFCLEKDSKNYHAWDYKLWITLYFKKQTEQIKWTESLIFKDNSMIQDMNEQLKQSSFKVIGIDWKKCYPMWSYRFNLLKMTLKTKDVGQKQKEQDQELQRMTLWIHSQKNERSEQGWNYLVGLLLNYSIIKADILSQFVQFSLQCYNRNKKNRFAANAYIQLSEFLQQKYDIKAAKRQQVLNSLLQSDKIRELYYKYLLSQ